jgi:L-threonylcarbamoyladenylate synthase
MRRRAGRETAKRRFRHAGKLQLRPTNRNKQRMKDVIDKAVHLLRAGKLVAFPTETVYGLGADATNPVAVGRIFAAKGRPATNPLIVHVADARIARRYAKQWPKEAEELALRFWPGPLTLVVPKADAIVPEVTAGLETVGLRSPDHPLALALLKAFDGPIAAPSANRSNRVSPTTADHVRRELGDAVDLILDGGPCHVGIESTVLDLTRPTPLILRPGAVTQKQIEQVVGPIEVFHGIVHPAQAAHSPGQQEVHYSPTVPAYRFTSEEAHQFREWRRKHCTGAAIVLAIDRSKILSDPNIFTKDDRIICMPSDPQPYARRLYAALHEADAAGVAAIFIELPPADPQWAAVRDRLIRATRPLR